MDNKPVTLVENPAEIDNPVLGFFLGYWNAKRGSRAMPSRADIAAQDIKEYLGWIALLEALPGLEDFRYRLLGTRLTEYFRQEATGRTLKEAYHEAGVGKTATDGALWLMRKTCQSRQPLRITGPGSAWRDRHYPDYDTLYLPLSEDGRIANMVLNVFTFNYAQFVRTKSVYALTKI